MLETAGLLTQSITNRSGFKITLSDAILSLHISSGLSRTVKVQLVDPWGNINSSCRGLNRLKIRGTCPDRQKTQYSTVQLLMVHRHYCVTFIDVLQTEDILPARLNSSLSKFIERRWRNLKGKRVQVHVRGRRAGQQLSCKQDVTHAVLTTAGECLSTATSPWQRNQLSAAESFLCSIVVITVALRLHNNILS